MQTLPKVALVALAVAILVGSAIASTTMVSAEDGQLTLHVQQVQILDQILDELKTMDESAANQAAVNEENEIKDNVRVGHPNRNTDKGDATNAGGYKN